MLTALPFEYHSQLCCDCIAVQPHAPHIVAVASYQLLPSASAAGDGPAIAESGSVGVGGQMRTGAVEFFAVDGEALRLLQRVPCAAGTCAPCRSAPTNSQPAPVFDADWSRSADACLAASSADGSLLLMSGDAEWEHVRVQDIARYHKSVIQKSVRNEYPKLIETAARVSRHVC
jgi:hypothetical protein